MVGLKRKVVTVEAMKTYGAVEVQHHSFLTSAFYHPVPTILGGRVVPRPGLDTREEAV